jgi:indolepyruvate ferredoxin oxidoreductase alpha subunit
VICDNSTTAMTGQQNNPASGKTIDDAPAPRVDLVKLVESTGVGWIRALDPYDMKTLRKTLNEAVRHPGPSVVIAQHTCLMLPEQRAKQREVIQFDADDCNQCKLCMDLGCPAMTWNDETGPIIDELQCVGCEMCAELCQAGALHGPEAVQ